MMKTLPSKTAPVRAGTQALGKHLIHTGENRKQRRARAVMDAKAEDLRFKTQLQADHANDDDDEDRPPLPESIWLITRVVAGMHVETKTPFYKLTIDRRTERDELAILSREGAAPVVGGLLERMTRRGGGEAAIWTDAMATKASVGGGYTRDAVPKEWGFPEPEPVPAPTAWPFVNLTLGEPWPALEDDMQSDVLKDYDAGVAILKGEQ